MKTTAHITYDTSRSSKLRSSYSVRIDASMSEDEITDELAQVGPNYNGKVHYVGVFHSKRAAQLAVQRYLWNIA